MKRRQKQALEEPTINITPLIDVVFVVLIMFIIIAPILEKDRIELSQNTSTQKDSKIEKSAKLSIQVTAKNQIFVNKTLCDSKNLDSIFKNHKLLSPETIPQVYYDKKAYFENFEPIKCALENAGFSDMDLILEPSH
jgi:biopolymer transport protein ExbD